MTNLAYDAHLPVVSGVPMLAFSSLTLAYGERVLLQAANGQLTPGSLTCIVGANGVGKSTLLRTLAGLIKPSKGSVTLAGQPLANLTAQQRAQYIAVVLTDSFAELHVQAQDIIALGQIPYQQDHIEQKDVIIEQAIAATGTQPLRHRQVCTLSDGERQRVAIARALAQDTPLLLMDEPLSHLDLPSRLEMLALFQKLAHRMGKTILMTTHELELAERFADEFWLLPPGGPLLAGAPEELLFARKIDDLFPGHDVVFNQQTGRFDYPRINYPCCIRVIAPAEFMPLVQKVLSRIGIGIEASADVLLEVYDTPAGLVWQLANRQTHALTELVGWLRQLANQHEKPVEV